MNKETIKSGPSGKRSKTIDFFIVVLAILAFCIFLAIVLLFGRNVFVKSARTPIPTETIRDLDSYNSAISNISSFVAVTNVWITSDASLIDNVHINVKNNSRWPIQIAKIILGGNPSFYNRTNQKLERPFNYYSAGFVNMDRDPISFCTTIFRKFQVSIYQNIILRYLDKRLLQLLSINVVFTRRHK